MIVKFWKFHRKRVRRISLVLGAGFLILWVGADVAIRVASLGRVYSKTTVDAVPSARAAVVLGCSRTVRGGLGNIYYQRISRRPVRFGQLSSAATITSEATTSRLT